MHDKWQAVASFFSNLLKSILSPSSTLRYIILGVALIFFVCVPLLAANYSLEGDQGFALIASSFLEGKLYFSSEVKSDPSFSELDTAPNNGRYYWPMGPFPAIVLMSPVGLFKFFDQKFSQGYLQFFFALIVAVLTYAVAKRFNFSSRDSFYWALAFFGGTAFLGVATISYNSYFAHVIAVLLLWLAIYEYFGRRRLWLIGLLSGFAFATRQTAGLIIIFFVFALFLTERKSDSLDFKKFAELFLPFGAVFALVLLYNYLRFGNFLESGYAFQTFFVEAQRKAWEYGVFSLKHFAGNFYYALLNPPQPVFLDGISKVLKFPFLKPDPWGIGIFFTSPYLLRALSLRYAEGWQKIGWATVALVLLSVFLFFGIGYAQFGYRYALDFLPLVFVIFMSAYRSEVGALSRPMRFLMVASVIVNFHLLLVARYF